jgi:hypothetical protein
MNTAQLLVPGDDARTTLRVAVAAYLARFKGQSRVHTESDLRSFLNWCDQQGLDPLADQRPHVELFLRWMQEIGRYNHRPSRVTVGRGWLLPDVCHRRPPGALTRGMSVGHESRPSPRRSA